MAFLSAGWDDVDSFAIWGTEGVYKPQSYIFVVGNDASSNDRTLACIQGDTGEVEWTKRVPAESGTPRV